MKIKNNNLISQEINTASGITFSEKEPTNYICLIDRSGSMYSTLPQLLEDLSKQLDTFDSNGFLTIGWFSGQGQNGWICKGTPLSQKEQIRKMLKNYNHTLGMTIFSEILADTETVIRDLSALSNRFSLCFFSDGSPTCGNYNTEVEKVTDILSSLSSKLGFSLFIGYSEHYNRDLLASMAQIAGGMLVHSSNLAQLNKYFVTFAETTEVSNKIAVDVIAKPVGDFAFSISGKNVVAYNVVDGKVHVPQDVNKLYLLTDEKVQKTNCDKVDESAAYAAAKLYSQIGKVDLAIDIVGTVGDVNFVDALNNAFTNAEYGKAEEFLGFAAVDSRYRFTKGKNTSYLPKDDEFCVIDLLELLQKHEAKFLPFHPAFEYQRTGKASVNKDGYARMQYDLTQEVPISSFTWNKSKLNLSLLAQLRGTVDLGEEAVKHGLQQVFPTYTYRNYTLIKDGKLNVEKLPIRLQQGIPLPMEVSIDENGVQILDLTALPVMNRAIAKEYLSAAKLAENSYREKEIECFNKYLKNKLDELLGEEGKKLKSEVLSEAQLQFLESKGIGKNGYAPPKETLPSTDFYYTKEFEVEVKGFLKSVPKISDFLTKLYGKGIDQKNLTHKSLFEIHSDFQNSTLGLSEAKTIQWIENKLSDLRQELWEIRQYAARTKFALLLAKQNLDGISKLEEETPFTHNEVEYIFKLKTDVKVEI